MSDTLMISVSGIRGHVGTDLTPELVARYAAALGAWVRTSSQAQAAGAARGAERPAVVLGRDARTSGPMFAHAATAGFMSVGVDVIDVGVVPTPTVQLAVEHHHAGAGLILTASHNPMASSSMPRPAGGSGPWRTRARRGWDGTGSAPSGRTGRQWLVTWTPSSPCP
jgi:phosphomannomutase